MGRPSSERRRQTRLQSRRAPDGGDVKRRGQEPRVLTTMRLRRSLRKDLETTAARTRRSVADVAQELLDEALRMRQCPGIYFAEEPSGRTAKIGGTGLAVWRSEEHTSELQSRLHLVCRLLLEKKKKKRQRKSLTVYRSRHATNTSAGTKRQ